MQLCDFHRTPYYKYRLFSIENKYYRLFSIESGPPAGRADGRRRRLHPCFFPFSHSSHYPALLCPTPVYKSRMYTILHFLLRFYVQVSAIRGDFDLFPKVHKPDLYTGADRRKLLPLGPIIPPIPPCSPTREHPREHPRRPTPTDKHQRSPNPREPPRITGRGIDESVLRRPGGGERDRWRCCSFRGRTAGRPTAPDTEEHIDCQSARRVASH